MISFYLLYSSNSRIADSNSSKDNESNKYSDTHIITQSFGLETVYQTSTVQGFSSPFESNLIDPVPVMKLTSTITADVIQIRISLTPVIITCFPFSPDVILCLPRLFLTPPPQKKCYRQFISLVTGLDHSCLSPESSTDAKYVN